MQNVEDIEGLSVSSESHKSALVAAVTERNGGRSCGLEDIFLCTIDIEEGEGEDDHLTGDDQIRKADRKIFECYMRGRMKVVSRCEKCENCILDEVEENDGFEPN